MYVTPRTTTPSEVLLTNNTASLGGNLYIESSSVIGKRSVDNTGPFHFVVRSGSAANFGGGMVCVGSTLDINWSLFEYNHAGISGGALYGVLCLMNGLLSVFRHNDAGNSGGGAMLWRTKNKITTGFSPKDHEKKIHFSWFVEILNLGFCVNDKTMLYKFLIGLVYTKKIGDSIMNENWYDEKWKLWTIGTKNLEQSKGAEHRIPKIINYKIPLKFYKYLNQIKI